MTTLKIEDFVIPSADLGPINPLPPLVNPDDLHAVLDLGADLPREMRSNMEYGGITPILPYMLQDGFNRVRRDTTTRVAILENDLLRATFLLERGGRLWSLVHRQSGQELLYPNPVFQPANLGARTAWFSGGVEWNIGTKAHSPLGLDPVHAVRVETPDGSPFLRMFEFERIRETPFQIDAHLPDGSPLLYVYIRIRNPQDREVPMLWWSNIAVAERPDVRVVAPSDHAFRFGYERDLRRIPVPQLGGTDISYTTNGRYAADYFFDIPSGQRPWIAALGGDGHGLIQASTRRLRGRKEFLWGMSPGGRHWQEFLSESGHPYLEIQAGLTQTQLEYEPMPAHASWSWVEAYGRLDADPVGVHGSWSSAQGAVEAALAKLLAPEALEVEHQQLGTFADLAPIDRLSVGSGWGALERRRRSGAGLPSGDSTGLPFIDESLGAEQEPWISLIERGVLPTTNPDSAPLSYVVDAKWRAPLEACPDTWLKWLYLGVIRMHAGEYVEARAAWVKSLSLGENAWAHRNLAVLDRLEGSANSSADRLMTAHRLAPILRPLTIETIRALIDAARPVDALMQIDLLDPVDRAHGRIGLLEVQAALAAGDLNRAATILAGNLVVPDLREGEVALDQLWLQFQEQQLAAAGGIPITDEVRAHVRKDFAIPAAYDFRMFPE